jgi:hypothetical protein
MIFKNAADLDAHLRLPVPCVVREAPHMPAILTKDQVAAVRSQGRRDKGATEEQKWIAVYRIVFPDDEDIPTPCMSTRDLGTS